MGHYFKKTVTTGRENVIENRSIANDFQSLQQCRSLVHVYLCSAAEPQKMHEEIKDFNGGNAVGKLSLCLIYEHSHNISHILPTCSHCAESSAEDKLAFK